jgi:hypothetical protein
MPSPQSSRRSHYDIHKIVTVVWGLYRLPLKVSYLARVLVTMYLS